MRRCSWFLIGLSVFGLALWAAKQIDEWSWQRQNDDFLQKSREYDAKRGDAKPWLERGQ